MQLKYKISISIILVSLSILASVSYIYSKLSYANIMKHEKTNLSDNVIDSARHIEVDLLDKLSNALTIASAPVVSQFLQSSNLEYEKFSEKEKRAHIAKLNQRWMKADSQDDSFIKPYLNNTLALFLKKQQSALPGLYGELFITNRHGAMIASTGKLTTLAHSQKYWWKESYAQGKGKVFFDDRGFDASVNGYVIGVVVPIKKEGETIGILKANVNIMNTLDKLIDHYSTLDHGSLKIVRTNGLIVYERGFPPLSTTVHPTILDMLKDKETGTSLHKDFAQSVLVAYAPVRLHLDGKELVFGGKPSTLGSEKGKQEGEIWHTVISYDKELALSDSKKTNELIIYIGLVITFLSALLAFIIGKLISNPIEKLAEAEVKLKMQEKILIAQSRQSGMADMTSMLAHQWRQPIAVIAMGANNMLANVELDNLESESIKRTVNKILKQTAYLSKTIDDFGNFFSPSKNKELLLVNDILEESFSVIGKSLENNKITVEKEYRSETPTLLYRNELLQVFMNILINAKEVLMESPTKDPLISVLTREDKESIYISICDNGKGVPEDIIHRIFEPYFSTKEEKNRTGLGLYMSMTIVQNHLHGSISVENREEGGVCFIIRLQKKGEENND
jgi:signal transduction histidine kinase